MFNLKHCLFSLFILAGSQSAMQQAVADEEQTKYELDIPSQPLSSAMKQLADATGLQVLYFTAIADGIKSTTVSGNYTKDEAVKLMLQGSELVAVQLDEPGSIAIKAEEDNRLGKSQLTSNKILVAQAATTAEKSRATPSSVTERNKYDRENRRIIEEVIVTAQKREESIQDVGIAITAWSGEQLESLGMENSFEIAEMTPGVSRAGVLGGQTSLFAIRGVVQNDFTDSTESPVAVYIDQGYVPMMQGQTFAMFDVERVEILRGPQGTLFGRNATGGLVHFITRKPTSEFETFVEATYGSYDQARVTGSISGPLGNGLSGRFSGMYNRHDEIMENVYPLGAPGASIYPFGVTGPGNPQPDDGWNDDTWALRGQLLFELNEEIEILVSAFGSRTETSEAPYKSAATIPVLDAQGRVVNSVQSSPTNVCEAIAAGTGACYAPGLEGFDGELQPTSFDVGAFLFGLPPAAPEDGLRPVAGGDFFGYVDPFGDDFKTSKDFSPDDSNEFETYGVTANLTWELGAATLTSVSNFMHFDKLGFVDAAPGPVPLFVFQTDSEEDTFSQEMRLSGTLERLRWTTGFYYLYMDNTTINGLVFPVNSTFLGLTNLADGSVLPGVFVPFLGAEANNEIKLETNSYSLFGQIDFDLTEKLTFIAGLRGIIEDKDYQRTITAYVNTDDARVETSTRLLGSGFDGMGTLRAPFEDSSSDTLWAGKLQLEYHPNDDWLLYAGINRGVKAGSFNAKLPDNQDFLTNDQIPYGEEVLTAYELGFKSTLFDGTTRFNGSFYYYDYDDYQAFVFLSLSGIVINNDAEIKGLEFELLTRPIQGLDLMLNVSWLDAEVTDLQIAPGVFKDTTPSFTPSVQWAGTARYEWPETFFGGTISLQASANYVSSFYHNIRNFESQKLSSYIVGNTRVSWASSDERWLGTVFVNNIADERYRNIGFDVSAVCGCSQESYGKPRWAGVSVRYSY